MVASRHVLIDGYFLGKPYGFGRYISELCRSLGGARSDLAITVAVPDRVKIETLPRYDHLTWHQLPDANFVIWEQILIPRLARLLSSDVIHFPYNTKALFTGRAASIMTVHDLIFIGKRPRPHKLKTYIAEHYMRLNFLLNARRSDSVVTASTMTQNLLRQRDVDATVIYHTVDGFLEQARTAPRPAGRRYILHRGGYLEHRNTKRVIEAFREARPKIASVDLKILGAPEGAGIWRTHGDDTIQFMPRLSDAELTTLYSGAACVMAASLEEGFGLPIIEGFGLGAPVITSNLEPMREVAGDAALLVDPFSVAAIAAALVAVLNDDGRSRTMVAKGRERMAAFASSAVAERMLSVYASCGKQASRYDLV